MTKLKALTIVTVANLAFAGLAAAQGDTLRMGEFASRFESPDKPSRGMTQERVRSRFGDPANRRAPVGDPPITRWEYADFVVFFEHDKVIHAVTKR